MSEVRPNTKAERSSLARTLGALFAGALVMLLGGVAEADVRTEARRHFRQGMALIADGNVDSGVAELQQAYEILPHPNVLYNIGRAYAESGRYQEAIEYFERYLESDPPDRTEVLGFLEALRARIQVVEGREGESEEEPAPEEQAPRVDAEAAEVASEEEITALEDSATQIEALAESAQSDALRARAERLRALAAALRERRAAAAEETTSGTGQNAETQTEHAGTGEQSETTEAHPAGSEGSLVLGQQREGDTYEEQVVSSSRAAQSPLDAPNSTGVVTRQDLRLSGLTNPGAALRRVAGVSLMETSPGDVQLTIRGFNQRLSNRAIVLIDGRSAYLDFLGTTLWTLLPVATEDIERIEVIRGPASALYGADAFTGVVNIITRPIGQYRSWVSSGLGTAGQLRVAGTVTRRIDQLSFRLGGGYDRANLYSRSVGPNRVDVRPYASDPNLGYDHLWFNGEAQLRIADGYTITAGTGISTGARSIQGISRLRELYLNNALFTQTYVQARTAFGLSARVFWNHFQTDYGTSGIRNGGIPAAQQGRVDHQDVADAELVYQNQFNITSGIQDQVIGGLGYRFKEIAWDWIQNTQTQHHFNVFLQNTLRIEDAVQIVLSGRLDRHPLLAQPQISPRGSVVIHPTPRQSIRVTGGYAFRSPTFAESYAAVPNSTPLRGVTAFGVGNTHLNPERIVSMELGYMLQESDYFSLEFNAYYNLVFNQILLSQNTAYRLYDYAHNPNLQFDPSLSAFALGQLQFANEGATFQQAGGELGLRVYPVDGLDVYANYAFNWTGTLTQPDIQALSQDRRTSAHKINAGVQYRASFGLDISADFSWVSDQVWVEQVLDTTHGGTAFVAFPLPAYAILNARIGWRFLDDRLEIAAVGTNLLMNHREHPFGQVLDRRFMGSVTFRY